MFAFIVLILNYYGRLKKDSVMAILSVMRETRSLESCKEKTSESRRINSRIRDFAMEIVPSTLPKSILFLFDFILLLLILILQSGHIILFLLF